MEHSQIITNKEKKEIFNEHGLMLSSKDFQKFYDKERIIPSCKTCFLCKDFITQDQINKKQFKKIDISYIHSKCYEYIEKLVQ